MKQKTKLTDQQIARRNENRLKNAEKLLRAETGIAFVLSASRTKPAVVHATCPVFKNVAITLTRKQLATDAGVRATAKHLLPLFEGLIQKNVTVVSANPLSKVVDFLARSIEAEARHSGVSVESILKSIAARINPF